MRVLVIDDHAEVRDLLSRALARDGHQTLLASSAGEARRLLGRSEVDLVVLDLGLPDGDGLALCRELRDGGERAPVLVLSAHSQVERRVAGLEAGADDYLCKPFAVAELRARVRALGRRGPALIPPALRVGGVQIDLAARRASRDGAEVPLTAREWSVLDLLARRAGRVVSKEEILEVVWADVSAASGASLEVIVGRIRRKLGDDVIRTVRGEGYGLGGL